MLGPLGPIAHDDRTRRRPAGSLRRFASLLALVVAGLASIATSIPVGLVSFESTGHVWVANGQPGLVDIHVQVDAIQAHEIERIHVALNSGVWEGRPSALEAALLPAQTTFDDADWLPVPAYWEIPDPECVAAQPCVRDYRIAIRSTEVLSDSVLVPWDVRVSVQIVRSYELVDVTIGPITPAPTPGLLGVLSAGSSGLLAMLAVAIAAWRTGNRRRSLAIAELVAAAALALTGLGLFVVALPNFSGSAVVLVVAAGSIGIMTWKLHRTGSAASPRIGLLAIALLVGSVVLTAEQIATFSSPIRVVLTHLAIGISIGVGVVAFWIPSWWHSRVNGSREWMALLFTAGLALLLAVGAVVGAATAIGRDPTPLVGAASAVLVLAALRRWATTSSVVLRIVGTSTVLLGAAIAFLSDRLGGGMFESVPAPPGPAYGPVAYALTIAAVGALVAIFGKEREPLEDELFTGEAPTPEPG